MFANLFNFTPSSVVGLSTVELLSIFFQHSTVYFSAVLFFIFLLTVLTVQLNLDSIKFKTLFNFMKGANILMLTLIFFSVFFKFIIYLWNYKGFGFFLSNFNWHMANFNCLISSMSVKMNSSVFSDVIMLLAFSSGIICIYLLGEKNLVKYLSNISIFSIFLVAIVFMVYTTNLLVMFVGFEFLFLPTLYFVYSHGYVQRVDKTIKMLLYWTLFGAFLVFSSMAYLYVKYKTLDYFVLMQVQFTDLESTVLYCCIFLGFGVKVPVFPFHYWLTKMHVEAPAGFSMFLSGFLVKAAVYCFYYFNLMFQCDTFMQITSVVALLGVIEASVKMWTQTDFKKLMAFATIQEMNLILYLLLNYQNLLDYSLILFILIHGWLSTLMFFLVDIMQKKTSSSNMVEISGMAYNFPELKVIIWFIILLFAGFPLTVKFLIEWEILGTLILQAKETYLMTFFAIVVVGVTGFAKQFIIILYGLPSHSLTVNYVLSKRDKYLFYLIITILVFLNLLNFFLG